MPVAWGVLIGFIALYLIGSLAGLPAVAARSRTVRARSAGRRRLHRRAAAVAAGHRCGADRVGSHGISAPGSPLGHEHRRSSERHPRSSGWRSWPCCCSCRPARSTIGRHGLSSPRFWRRRSSRPFISPGPTRRRCNAACTAARGRRPEHCRSSSSSACSWSSSRCWCFAHTTIGWAGRSCPLGCAVLGDVLVATGLGIAMLVVIQNGYAAATVTVETGQKVVSTGVYKFVRHPMYVGNVVMMVGIPLALGSYWGLLFVLPGVAGARLSDPRRGNDALPGIGRLPRVRARSALPAAALRLVAGRH